MEIKILRLDDIDKIQEFEEKINQKDFNDPTEFEFFKWRAPWRREALEQYLPMGWSFAIWGDDGYQDLRGYFLAQTLLFLDCQTQSLWVEHLAAADPETMEQLIDTAYRHSREKHFQRVYFRDSVALSEILPRWNPQDWHGDIKFLKTTKG